VGALSDLRGAAHTGLHVGFGSMLDLESVFEAGSEDSAADAGTAEAEREQRPGDGRPPAPAPLRFAQPTLAARRLTVIATLYCILYTLGV